MITLKPTAIFPTPLLLTTLGAEAADLNRAILRDAYVEKNSGPKAKRSGVDAWQSRLGMERKYVSFEKLRGAIEQIAHAYLPMIGYPQEMLPNIGAVFGRLLPSGKLFPRASPVFTTARTSRFSRSNLR